MDPITTRKDSDSIPTSNPFEEFNGGLTGVPAKPVKKDSTTLGKPIAETTDPFKTFNESLKKKDLPGASGAGVSPVSKPGGLPEGSTSSSSGEPARDESIVPTLKKNLEDAAAFIRSDISKQPQLSIYPPVMGPDNRPLPQQPPDPNSGQMPEEVKLLTYPDKLSEYINSRVDAITSTIKGMESKQKSLIKRTPVGASYEQTITDPGQYHKLTGEINQQREYLKTLKNNATEVIANSLVRDELNKPGNKFTIGVPRELGRNIIRYADKQTNDQFTALEERNVPLGAVPSADMERIGIDSWKKYLLVNEDIPNREQRIQDVEKWEESFDERNFELTAARVRHKIAADLKKRSGFGSSIYRREPSTLDLVASANSIGLSPAEMKIFNTYVLPIEAKNLGTDIPMSGFVNKFGEAIQGNTIGLGNLLRSDEERISEALNQSVNTRFDEVGEFAPDKLELNRLREKEKSKEGISELEKTRKKELENYVDVRRWYDKFWDGAGDLTGQVAYQAGLARLFGGVGNLTTKAPVVGGLISKGTTFAGGADAINLMMTSFLTAYDNHAKEAALLMPRKDQALERRMYAFTMSSVEGLTERIFPDTKVLDAFKKSLAPDVVKLSSRLAAKEISEEAAKTRLQQIISTKLKPFAKQFVKAEVQEGTEEAVVDIAQGVSDTIFAGKQFDPNQTFGNAAETFLTTMAYSPFVSGLAATKDVRQSSMGKSGLYKMSVDPETYRREIYRQVEEGLPQSEADKRLQIINTAAEIQKQLPVSKSLDPKKNPELAALNSKWKENIVAIGERTDIDEAEKEKLKGAEDARSANEIATYMKEAGKMNNVALDYNERANYLTHRLNEALLEKQIGETTDDVIKADLERQRDRSKRIREGIFNGTIIVGNNLDEITADEKLADELGITPLAQADEDTLPINIVKPKIEQDEKDRSAGSEQQTAQKSESGQHIGQENSTEEQAVRPADEALVNATATGEGSVPTLPSGMSQEQFNKLPENIQQKLLSKAKSDAIQKQSSTEGVLRNEGVQGEGGLQKVEPGNQPEKTTEEEEITQPENDAIASINAKDFTGTGIAPYAAVLKNPNATAQEKKAALRGISDQLNATASAEPTDMALGRKLSEQIYDLGYPKIDEKALISEVVKGTPLSKIDPATLRRRKAELESVLRTPDLPQADVESINEELEKVNAQLAPATQADVSFQPLQNIGTDVERFQPRGTDFSPESVNKIVEDYDENKLDPVVLYKDPSGKDIVLAGHSRLEAHNRLSALPDSDPVKQRAIEKGFRPGEIKSRYFTGTEKEAMEFADRSNDLGTKNKDYESANSLRKMREAGDTKTAIKDRARTDFGKNWRYLYTLSHLNPNGKLFQTLKQFDANPDKDAQNQIEKAGQWIGAARERFGDLISDQHENEMFDFLMDRGRSTKIQRENDFLQLIQNVTGGAFYNPNEPLNLNRIKNKSTAELNYDTEEADIKEAINERQKDLDNLNDRLNNPQNPAYVNPNSSDYSEVLRNAEKKKTAITTELTALRKELVEHQQSKGKVISAGLAQPGLFDMNNLTPEEVTGLNNELAPDGITVENIQSYEQDLSIPEEVPEENRADEGQTGVLPEAVRQPENDQSASAQQDPGSEAIPGQERTSPAVDPVEQEKLAKLADAKKAFKDSLRKSRGNLNASIVPIDPEVIANGVKLMAAYADLGIYRFKQIVQDIADSFGSDFIDKQNMDALKGVYSYYRSNQPKEQRSEFDTEEQVDNFFENELQAYTSAPNDIPEERHLQNAIDESTDNDERGHYEQELADLTNDPFNYWRNLFTAYIDPSDERAKEAWRNLRPMIHYSGLPFVNKNDPNDVVYVGNYPDGVNVEVHGNNYRNRVMPVHDFLENYDRDNRPENRSRGLSDFNRGDYIKDKFMQNARMYQIQSFKNGKYELMDTSGNIKILYDNDKRWLPATEVEFLDNLKSKTSGTGTATNLESDSPRATTGDTVGQGELFPIGKRDIIEPGENEPAVIKSIQPAGSPGLLPFDAVTTRAYGDSQLPISEQLAGLETSPARNTDSGRSDIVDETGVSPERRTDESVENIANDLTGSTIAAKIEAQKAAESIPVKDMDLDNIRATLPFLMKEQQEDVYKAENRFIGENNDESKLYGKGMLFTNGTGTGKTLTGLGIAKRMIKRGKGNILIVVPSDVKAKDWIAEGQDYMQIPIHQLTGTLDGGEKGANITTYANFRENPNVKGKTWDLVIYDESHKINSNGSGQYTAGEDAHKTTTSSPRIARTKAKAAIKYDSRLSAINEKNMAARERNEPTDRESIRLLDEELKQATIKEFQKTKVVFLSATPFSYHPNLTYADGYLFKINEDFDPNYESNSYNNFYISNFGYRIRYNKLTKPESGVDVDLLERQFTENLKKQGVVVSRKLNVDKDYSRQFVLVDDELGTMIDEGLSLANDRDEFPDLWEVVNRRMTFLYKNQLMEGIKSKWAIDRIKKHLALGRKVVVSHSYNNAEPSHPFDWDGLVSIADPRYTAIRNQIRAFHDKYPQYRALDLSGLSSPIDTLRKAFGKNIVFFNGEETKKDRNAAKKIFNDDNSGVDIMVVQMEAGKEGISLHDKTGVKPRALINLGLPYKPTDAIQIEGRIYRTGQKSDAVIEYAILNLAFERYAYASKINERVRTAENFALGEEARNMETAFKEGYLNGTAEAPSLEQGKGGKEDDARADATGEFQKTLTYYYKRGKRTAAQKRGVSGDYYATPEPLGYKMAEWMDLVPNEKGLEPSAGHGAIARFFPRTTKNIFIEPNTELRSEVAMNGFGETKAGTFEDLNIINKFDGIALNPPFGHAGKLAMDHLEKALGHLHDGGRAVALVPTGKMNDRINDWLDSDKSKGFYITAKIQLPSVVFERAGTQVRTQILVIDKVLDKNKVKDLPQQRNIDLTRFDNIKDFFDAIEDLSLPKRIDAGKYAEETVPNDPPEATQPAPGEPAPLSDLVEIIKNFHEKAKRDNWVVKLKKQVNPDEFKSIAAAAKDMGGYWSSFKGNGATPGFQFDNEQSANNLVSAIEGKDVPEAPKMSLADRIRTWKIAQTGRQLYSTIIPGGPQIWNAAVEIVARSVEAGTALIDALNTGREYIEKNWNKSWQKAKYNGEMMMELKGRGVLSYNLSPSQRAEADAAISRVERTGQLIKEINDLREAFDYAKTALTDPQDIQELEDSYNEFERYLFDGLAAQEIEKMHNFSLDLEDQTWWQKQKENWQNRFQRLEQIQKEIEKAGLTIEEKNDMVNRADRWKSIAAAKIDNILREVGLADVDVFVWKGRKKLENSLFDRMAKDGVDYRKFNLYMYARHAPERNAHNAKLRREAFAKKIAQIEMDIQKYKDNYAATPNSTTKGLITRKENELKVYQEYEAEYNNPSGNKNYLKMLEQKIDRRLSLMDDGGSGMTNQQAEDILKEVDAEGNRPMFEAYETSIQEKVIQQSLDLQKEYGLIDDTNYEYLKNYYQNYVPLKVDDSYFEKGQTFTDSGIPGAKIYKSKGANYLTYENRINPLTQAIIDLQATIFEGEQNKYKQTVAETIRTAPDKDIWEDKPALFAPIKDKHGKVVGLDEINAPANGIPYYDNGQKRYLVINDKALYEAMTGANVKNAIPILSKINGFFRSLYTVYNPAFTVSNLFRDVETAGIVMSATQKGDVAANFRGNVRRIFQIIRGAYQAQGGADSTYWQQRAKEYKDAGGNMTWFQQDTANDQMEDIEAAYKKYEQGGAFEAGKNLALKVADFVTKANSAVENSTRLAMYDAMIKTGVPQYKAVEIARNATINFQKKGNYGAMVDSLYLFYNASVQGTTNVLKTLLTTRAGLKMAGGIIMAGALLNVYNNLMSHCGPDADPANCYDNIPDYEKERNMIIKNPGGKGFIKIPLAWGFNVFFNGGEQISQMIHGKSNWQHAAAFIAKSAFNSFNPTGGVDQPVLQHLSPTATDPIVQWFTNKDAFGRPIYNDFPFDKRPDSQRGFGSDSKNAKKMADWLNSTTGGNDKVKGKVDVSPGTLDFFFETFTGGLGQFSSQVIGSTRDAFDPKTDVEVRSIPIINRFYTMPKERSNRQLVFNRLDDSYNTVFNEEQLKTFNEELDKAVKLKDISADKAAKYRNTVTRNQYELNNQELFSVIEKSKFQKLEKYEIENFVEDLERRAASGEIPSSWIRSYKSEITKNQKKVD